ncbi:hypothetical protein JGU66_14995 [Myxococcaceae bacterium JPH2]|nr:hypothetical protein [Myxococcaceae bacterium JPH2]
MRLVSMCVGALPLVVATAAQAQVITPVQGSRSVSAGISAVDAITNVVHSDSHGTTGFAPFSDSIVLKANTQYEDSKSRVDADGSGTGQSTIGASRITASVSATARGVAMDPSARGQGQGNADFYLTFNVNRVSRYVVSGSAQAASDAYIGAYQFGGSTALLYIADITATRPILSLDIGNLDGEDSSTRTGWIPAGQYTLQGDVSALVDAQGQGNGSASASWSLDLQLFCPSDYDVNGTVNLADRTAFLNAWQAGQLAADVDGNGTVDATDRTLFLSAYNTGC